MQKDFLISLKNKPHIFGKLFGFNDLSDLHSEWIKLLFDTKENTALQAHRESYKTSTLILGIIRELILCPEKTILILRKTDTDASMVLQAIGKKIESEEGQALFKKFYQFERIRSEKWTDSKLNLSIKKNTTVECNLESIGIGGSVTGKHPDMIIVDDIITLKDRVSKAEREFVKIYIQELLNVVKKTGKIIFTGTIWHKDDAWKIIEKIAGSILKYSVYDTKIIPEKKIAELRKNMTPSLFSANYELKHINDEGRIFGTIKYGWENCNLYGYLDTAYSGKNTTALSLVGTVKGKYFATGKVWNRSVIEIIDEIVFFLKKYNTLKITVESNADKGYTAKELRKKFHSVNEVHETQNKHQRITQALIPIWDMLYFKEETDMDYLSQIADYQENEDPDDAPDSLCGAIRMISKGSFDPYSLMTGKI